MPPLIKGYLKLGAKVVRRTRLGSSDFNAADFPVLLRRWSVWTSAYRRHFGLDQPAARQRPALIIMRRLIRRMTIRLIRRATWPLRMELKQLHRETDLSPFRVTHKTGDGNGHRLFLCLRGLMARASELQQFERKAHLFHFASSARSVKSLKGCWASHSR